MGKGTRLREQRQAQELPGTPAKRGFQLKIERALDHLDELDREIKSWLERDAYDFRIKPQAKPGENILSVVPLQPVPADFQPIIGDCVHNLRSALDLLAFDLAWAGRRGPMSRAVAENSEFPVFWSRAPRTAELRKRIGAVDPAAQAVIQALQPHRRPNGFAADDLWILDQLWNFDKHRGLPLTLLAVVGFGIGRPGDGAFIIKSMQVLGGGPIRAETDLLRYSIEGEMDVKRAPDFNVALGQGTPAEGEPLVPLLTRLKDYVIEQIIAPLQEFI